MIWNGAFADKRVLVTGASSGIGREAALAFAAAGAKVGLVARRREPLEAVAEDIRSRGGWALALPADVTRPAAVRRAFAELTAAVGGVDIVLNNAGLLIPARVDELNPKDLTAMFRVNVVGAVTVMQEALRTMRRRGDGGCIINLASLAGRRGVSPLGGYCATKFALIGLTEALRSELYGNDIHVGLVLPGVVDTPMAAPFADNDDLGRLWPTPLHLPASWVVWAIFAAVQFRLAEISVPPGAATLEELAVLVPGLADSVLHWGTRATESILRLLR